MRNKDACEPFRRGRRRPSELERLIPMVGLLMSGLEDWRPASWDQGTARRCPACGSELSSRRRSP